MIDKPYGVKAERLWLGVRISIFDPKIGEPYASQIEKEIDEYVSSVVAKARSQAFEEASKIANEGIKRAEPDAWANGYRCASADISQAIRQHSQKGRDK